MMISLSCYRCLNIPWNCVSKIGRNVSIDSYLTMRCLKAWNINDCRWVTSKRKISEKYPDIAQKPGHRESIVIYSFESPRARGCVYFSKKRGIRTYTCVCILGARYVNGIAAVLLLDRRRSPVASDTTGMNGECVPWTLGRCSLMFAMNEIMLNFTK